MCCGGKKKKKKWDILLQGFQENSGSWNSGVVQAASAPSSVCIDGDELTEIISKTALDGTGH